MYKTFGNESAFTRWFCKMIEARGAYTVAIVGGRLQQSGIPDRYIAHRLFRGWVEFKRHNTPVTKLQHDFIRDIRSRGDVALVVRLLKGNRFQVETEDNEVLAWCDLMAVFSLKTDRERGEVLLTTLVDAWSV